MPVFHVTAPDGRKLRLEGDSEPTEQELDDIFSKLGGDVAVAEQPKAAEELPLGRESLAFEEPPPTGQPDFPLYERPLATIPLLGRAIRGAGQDIVSMFEPMLATPRPEDVPEFIRDAQARPKGMPNLEAALRMEPLPIYEDIAKLPPALQVAAKAGPGLLEAAPQIAGVAALQAAGVPAPLGAAALFGITEEGGFDPKAAAIAAAIPFVGKYSGEIGGLIARRFGVSGTDALNIVKGASGLLGPSAALLAEGEHSIAQLPAEQREAARIDLYANLLGQAALGPVGVKYERPANARAITSPEGLPQPEIRTRVGEETPLRQRGETPGQEAIQAPQEGAPGLLRLTPEEWRRDVAPVLEESTVGVRLAKLPEGAIESIDRTTGEVLLSETEFADWLRSRPQSQRQRMVRSLVSEGEIHLAVPDEAALAYLKTLTQAEVALGTRIYTGQWRRPGEISETMLGHDLLRLRMQQAARMDVREFVEASLTDRLGLQTLDALSRAIQKSREVLGTKASKEGLSILEKMQENVTAARAAVTQGAPTQEKPTEGEAPEEPFAFNKEQARKDRQEFDEMERNWEVLVSRGDFSSPEFMELYRQREAIKNRQPGERKGFPPPTMEQINAMPEEAPLAMRKKGREPEQELPLFLPPIAGEKAKPSPELPRGEPQQRLALPPAEGRVERSGWETATPTKISEMADRHLKGTPDFTQFSKDLKLRFGSGVKREQLHDVWEDAVWRRVLSATGEELSKLRQELKLVSHVGSKEIADVSRPAPKSALEAELTASAKATAREAERTRVSRQRYRQTVASAVARKLIAQVQERSAKKLFRAAVEPDDVAFEKPDAYREISGQEAASPVALSRMLSEGARASSKKPVSNTRRVVVLVNKSTGEVNVVSAYPHGVTGMLAVDPRTILRGRPNVPLSSLLKTYRPIATMLLVDPVKNFKQRFESVAEWNDKFANEARGRVQEQASREALLEEGAGVIERVEEQPSALEPGQRLTPAQAGRMLDVIYDTVRELESPQDIADTVAELADTFRRGKPNWDAIAGFQKAYDALRRANPDTTLQDLYEDIYRKASESKTREAFQERALQSYGGADIGNVRPISEAPVQPSETGRELRALDRPPIPTRPLHAPEPSRPFPFERGGPQAQPLAFNKRTRDIASRAARSLASPVSAFSRWYGQWLTDAVRSNGREGAAQAADIADAIIDRAKKLYGGQTPVLNPAKEAAGGSARLPLIGEVPSPRAIKENVWLSELKHPVSKDTGIANVQEAVEGRLPAPASLQSTINAIGQANLQAGRVVQPVTPGFVPSNKWQRNLTAYGFDMLAEGPSHPNWKSFTRDTALDPVNQRAIRAANPQLNTRGDVIRFTRGFFREWGAALKDPASDVNRIERINQDFTRFFPRSVTHVRTPIGYQEIIHANPVNYLEFVAQRAAFTRAFREQFPNDPNGRRSFAQMDEQVRSELPPNILPYWDALLKTMQSRPADSYTQIGPLRPGTFWGEMAKGFNQTALATLKRLALSAQSVMGTPETLGTGVAELGMKNKLRSAARLKQLWPEMEKNGQVNAMIYDWSFDPSSPIRSVFRQFNNVIAKGFAENLHNELQGRWNAAMAIAAADRIRNQASEPLTAWEKRQYPETFRKMQFTKDQVQGLMAGDGALLAAFERRFPSWMSGENAPMSERSMGAQKRWFNSVFAFQPYPMTVANQFTRNLKRVGEAFREGTAAEKKASLEGMSRFLFAKGAQGLGYLALGSLVSGGIPGLKVKGSEAKDEPMEFMAEALMASLSGPYYLVWQAMRRGGGLAGAGETATRTLFPFSQVLDLQDMVSGNGQYKDQDTQARIGRYFMQKVPAARAIRQGLAAVGLSDANTELEAAMKGLYRWKREELGYDDKQSFREEDNRKAFRTEMRAAVTALQTGNFEEYRKRLATAVMESAKLGGKNEPSERVASSLRGRKVLRNVDGADLTFQQLDALTKRIGEDAVERLRYYDATLEAMAGSL